jgi:small subunit ribosomal protein S3
MWQKVDPRGFRVWVTKSWSSEWFAKTKAQSAQFFVEDIKIRNYIEEVYKRSWISKVVIRKTEKEWEIILFTAKPALILGKDGAKLKELEKNLSEKFWKQFKVVIKDVKVPELSAKIMAEFAATQIESRMPYRKVAKIILQKVKDKWAVWVKVIIAWRLGGTDIARSEMFIDGRVSLQTLRADIDYHYTTALTKYGIIGIKVWIGKGELYTKSKASKKVSSVSK